MPLGDVEPLHGRELVRARRVRDLERADRVLVARYHLRIVVSVITLVGIAGRAPEHQVPRLGRASQ